jgi:hypothetical protein
MVKYQVHAAQIFFENYRFMALIIFNYSGLLESAVVPLVQRGLQGVKV